MNQKKTTSFNQDAFIAYDSLPGNISPALSTEITVAGVRTDALPITSYTTGDTSGKPDSGLPEVPEAHTPKRISRKHIPIQPSGSSQNAVFPQNGDDDEFFWRPQGYQHDAFVSVKNSKPSQVAQEKGGPSQGVIGTLKQLGHFDGAKSRSGVGNHCSINTDGRGDEPKSILTPMVPETESQFKSVTKTTESPLVSKQRPNLTSNTSKSHTNTNNTQTNSDIYEQVREILGEDKQGWKQVIKTARSTTKINNNPIENSTLASQENQIEQVIQKVLSQEINNRVELEHLLTHKFSSELTSMQQSMNKKIQELREMFNNFMMR